ncbi:DHA2 family efflux MFS transporter permease subunit [Streptomyces sp. p1417]|uniref:DHA2 family efflux MFS transporter permease subunit n=1 Tax=Streptomyces typhae TaxID=2681492 RepID=A0A6L6WVA6_9ACTN|nr:MFS transporter [Streptomyces typhae]MVO86013.1 DHA2 family efflux MFS transporter permease subunit [Streptomyces typhae]
MTSPISTPAAQGSDTSQGSDRRRWFALAIVMTAAFMDLVDVTIVNIAIPSIQRDAGATFSQIQWITAGYALALGAGLITGGRLGDIYGRKKIFLVGIAGFTVASALCGFAANPEMLVASRILQGAMAALMVPQVLSIVHATFPAHERGKVFGLFGMIVGLGAVSGPLLGALLTEWNILGLEWRPIFLINLPVGVAGLLLGRKYIEESRAPRALKLDLVGVVLVTAGLLMLLYPLTRGHELDWPVWGYVMMAGGIVVFGALVAYEKRKAERDGSPLIELSLFKVKSFAGGIAVQTVFGISLGIFFLVWTLYMQVGLGWSALRAGTTGIPFSIAVSAAAGLSVQQLVPRFGRKVLQAGALTMAAGVLIYIWEADRYGASIASWQMALPLVVMGVGMGLIVAPLTDAVLSEVPREHAGSASGLINTVQQMGNALGLGLVSVVFFGVIDEKAAPQQVPTEFVNAFESALWWVVGILVAIFLLMLTLPKRPAQHIEGAEASPEAGAVASLEAPDASDAAESRKAALL